MLQNSRFLLVIFTSLLFGFSAGAIESKETYIPGKYELARREQTMIERDKKLVDIALQEILPIFQFVGGYHESLEAIEYLEQLVDINLGYELGSDERREQLVKLCHRAKNRYLMLTGQMATQADDLDVPTKNEQSAEIVAAFLRDATGNLRKYQTLTGQFALSMVLGFGAGCGVGLVTYLNGERWVAVCPTASSARAEFLLGADVTLEYAQGETNSNVILSQQLHRAVGLSVVNNIGCEEFDRNHPLLHNNEQLCRGVGAGLGIMTVESAKGIFPVLPYWPSLDFAMERLGITYEKSASN